MTRVPPNMADWFGLNLDPAGQHPDVLPVGKVVQVTGMFDHPAAASCTRTEMDGEPVPSQGCRLEFAVTRLVTIGSSGIVLRQAPADLGCDAIGVEYHEATFHIDPAATEQVSALTDTGVSLLTYWSAGFQPGTPVERVVRDPAGRVVVADGDVFTIPAAAQPRLHGYFVCLGSNELYVLLADPS